MPKYRWRPLSLGQFYVLVAASHKKLHAYGIYEQVSQDSGGAVVLQPGSIFWAINVLVRLGYLSTEDEFHGKRRYILTASGLRRLEEEVQRYERAANTGQRHIRMRQQRLYNP